MAWATFGIFVATAVSVGVAIAQWRALSAQLQAFKTAEGAVLAVHPNPLAGDIVVFALKNIGRLPSPHVVGTAWILRLTRPEQKVHYSTHRNLNQMTELAPGVPYTVPVPLGLKPGDLEKLNSGALWQMVMLILTYDNGFGERGIHRYCFTYAPPPASGWDVCAGTAATAADNVPTIHDTE